MVWSYASIRMRILSLLMPDTRPPLAKQDWRPTGGGSVPNHGEREKITAPSPVVNVPSGRFLDPDGKSGPRGGGVGASRSTLRRLGGRATLRLGPATPPEWFGSEDLGEMVQVCRP